MLLCLVTDRRRLGVALGLPRGDWIDALKAQVKAAGKAGIDFIQVRETDLESRDLTDLVRTLAASTAGTPSRLLVNDRVDVALAANADGVHLKERSIAPELVRRITPRGFVIGCSVHGISGVAARNAADFLIAGTVKPTASKPSVDYLEIDGLRGVVEAAAGQPVLGIGGLDLPAIPQLASTGAAGMAAIGAFVPAAGEDLSEIVQFRVTAMRKAFDSARSRT